MFFFFFSLSATVVQTLAHNSTATLSVIKDYLINKLQRESQQIEEDERKIRQYREETALLRSEIQDLKTRWVAEWIRVFYHLTAFFPLYFINVLSSLLSICTVPRYSRRPSATCATVPWSCRQFISSAATPSTSTALTATLRARQSVPPALRRTAKSWTCYVHRTRSGTCTTTSTDR